MDKENVKNLGRICTSGKGGKLDFWENVSRRQ